jgi:cyanophycinase
MEKTNSPGALVIIGGAEDREGECRILREFLTLCGGTSARIVIIAVASEEPDLVGSRYVGLFRQLGANEIEQLNIVDREDANKDEAVQSITKANGVFFTGGNQLRITRLLGGTKIDTAIHKQHENGLVLAGTSAGAAMMSTIMIWDRAWSLFLAYL